MDNCTTQDIGNCTIKYRKGNCTTEYIGDCSFLGNINGRNVTEIIENDLSKSTLSLILPFIYMIICMILIIVIIAVFYQCKKKYFQYKSQSFEIKNQELTNL